MFAKKRYAALVLGLSTVLTLTASARFLELPVDLLFSRLAFGASHTPVANKTWDGGGGADTSWNNPVNWSDNTVPGPDDFAIFDASSPTNTTINVDINVGVIRLESGYAQTITQSAGVNIILIGVGGTSGYEQAAGTFIGGTGAITVNNFFTQTGGVFTGGSGNIDVNGTFNLSGGTFTESSNITFVSGGFNRGAGGTFIANNGTVVLDGNVTNNNNFNSTTVNNLTFNKTGGAAVLLNSTVIVAGTLTLADGLAQNGTIEARGAVSVGAGFNGGSAVLNISVSHRFAQFTQNTQVHFIGEDNFGIDFVAQ